MGQVITIYADQESGNCLKIRYVAEKLGIPFEWIETSVLAKATHSEAFLRLNPAGQVPVVVLADGRVLSQSGAIIWYLAEGSALIPHEAYARAQMLQWMFWEQYSHEPVIAVRRFKKHFLKLPDAQIDPALLSKGEAVLGLMDRHLAGSAGYFVGESLTLADIALAAYTRLAHEGGFDLAPYPALRGWIGRVEKDLNLPACT